jgi:hypothetical protein
MVHAKARVTSAASKLKGGTATGTKRKSDPEAAHERDGDHARARADVGSADAIRAAPRPGHAGAPQLARPCLRLDARIVPPHGRRHLNPILRLSEAILHHERFH